VAEFLVANNFIDIAVTLLNNNVDGSATQQLDADKLKVILT
jgi:hypothetical protein